MIEMFICWSYEQIELQYVSDSLEYMHREKEHTLITGESFNKSLYECVIVRKGSNRFVLNNKLIISKFIFYHCFLQQGHCTDTWILYS